MVWKLMSKGLFVVAFMLLVAGLVGCDGEEMVEDGAEEAAEGEAVDISVACSAEWVERDDGMNPFQEHYGFEFDEVVNVELGLTYSAVKQGDALVGVGDATEGRIIEYDLAILEDDQEFFPAYNAAPTVRQEVLEANPEIEDLMREISSRLDLDTQTELNLRTAVEEEDPEDVARDFLEEEGLLTGETVADAGEVTVSSKTFAEALTQGWMTYYLLEDRGFDVNNEIGLGEVAIIRPALEQGEIDIYWEYTGTGLMNVMGYEGKELPEGEEETFQEIHDYDKAENDIKWLDYAPANNTFVLFVTEETQAEYGWDTLSDLAEFANQ